MNNCEFHFELKLTEFLNRIPFNIPKSKIIFKGLPKDDPMRRKPDIKLAKKIIGWQPEVTLEQGLKETWNWFISNQEEYLKRKNYFAEGK